MYYEYFSAYIFHFTSAEAENQTLAHDAKILSWQGIFFHSTVPDSPRKVSAAELAEI